jgi:hypothetical protein
MTELERALAGDSAAAAEKENWTRRSAVPLAPEVRFVLGRSANNWKALLRTTTIISGAMS